MGSILTARAQYIQQQGQIDANRIAQAGKNERAAAESDLQRFSQALGNKRIMEAAGKNQNAASETIARNLDAATYGDVMTQLSRAEELGSVAAMAAAAGMGGSSVQAYNDTITRTNALQQELTDRALKTDLYNANTGRGQIMTDAVQSFDNNVYRADIDYTRWADARKPSTLGSIITLGLAAGATALGGPSAGMAVLNTGSAIMAANQGNLQGAAAGFDAAIGSSFKAVKDYRDTGGNFWSSVKAKNDAAQGGSNDFVFTRSAGIPDWTQQNRQGGLKW